MTVASANSLMLRELGARLHARRRALGMTQQELADQACYDRSAIAHIEAGRQDVPVTRLALLAYLLGLDLDVLLTGISILGNDSLEEAAR